MRRALIMILVLAMSVSGGIFLVSSCGSGGSGGDDWDLLVSATEGSDITGDGVTIPFKTIGAAMATAQPGMVVKVMPGVYDSTLGEAFPIELAEGVTLVGDADNKGEGAEPTEIDGASLAYSGKVSAVVSFKGGSISGFSIANSSVPGSYGILNVNSDITIEDNTFSAGDTGVRVEGAGNIAIRDNDFMNSSYAIYDSGSGSLTIISNNYFEGGEYAIRLSGGDAEVSDNTFTGQFRASIQTMLTITPTISSNEFISNTYQYGGIHTFNTSNPTIRGNTFTDSEPCILLYGDSSADIGTSADHGMNNFTAANGTAVYSSATGDAQAHGNTWANDPPQCGVDIITANTGSVYFGTGWMEYCEGYTDPVQRLAFYTSTIGPGDISSWSEVSGSGLTGLDAADGICQARADAAGLTGTFAAWLSDDTDDAYCRVHGLTGTKAGNCGQSVLPTSAGPWFRTDGKPFSGDIEDLTTSDIIYHPAMTDEYGSVFEEYALYWTATGDDGVATGDNCSGWTDSTSGSLGLFLGATYGTVTQFTMGGYISGCSGDYSLLCLETGYNNVMPAPADTGKVVFVTSVSGNGNLGGWSQAGGETGILAGDNICQELASTAGLSNLGSFKAWLSDTGMNAYYHLISDGPYVRVDGVQVAASKSALINTWLETSISVTEQGDYVSVDVWTGTLASGIKHGETCSNWTAATGSGQHGYSTYADGERWTEMFSTESCNSSLRLYCFED